MNRLGKEKLKTHAIVVCSLLAFFSETGWLSPDFLDTSFNTDRFFTIPTGFDRVTANAKHLLPDEKSIPPLTA